MNRIHLCLSSLLLISAPIASSAEVQIEAGLVHLRIEGVREWSSFPNEPDAHTLDRSFSAARNSLPLFLRLRHQDVKQTWHVELNGKRVGDLKIDENDMVEYFVVPVGGVADGENTLRIYQDTKRRAIVDDIRVGEVVLGATDIDSALSASKVEVNVVDADTGLPLPSRLTITNAAGALQTVGAQSNDHLAVRPGIVFTSTGIAEFGLPRGSYTITAGRGFEYSIASEKIHAEVDGRLTRTLKIRREVPTDGYVACDTHVHTLTHSGHGDATVQERMITLAAEGIELPIATDHNVQIDHRPFARQMKVNSYFTPVIGNEVTTQVGHFNIWPLTEDSRVPNHDLTEWGAIADELFQAKGARVAILNHARDVHSGTRPFGSKLHNSASGTNLDGWPFRFNAMEVVNSGATQTDAMQLFRDWMGLTNAGYRITPVGCSDSHDVGRHFVGQGRTYIRCNDQEPANIDVDHATTAFVNGEVLVSYGLICEMTADAKYKSGSVVLPGSGHVSINIRVLGPHWSSANEVLLFSNGEHIRSFDVTEPLAGNNPNTRGVHAEIDWTFKLPPHDVHLVAIAIGPGIDGLYWKTAKAYQPTSPNWTARTIGCSGAIWIDADKDGRRTPAIDYARRVVEAADYKWAAAVRSLSDYDRATATQVASLLQQRGTDILSSSTREALEGAPPSVREGFSRFQTQWRENQIARSQR